MTKKDVKEPEAYRIIYASPPWDLDDEQLKKHRVGGRLVKDVTDRNAVLFLWVPSPSLERCFAIIEAWGFEYKSSLVWDKVNHVPGPYNAIRHEFLLIATKGSCKPDVRKLIDSVQSFNLGDRGKKK